MAAVASIRDGGGDIVRSRQGRVASLFGAVKLRNAPEMVAAVEDVLRSGVKRVDEVLRDVGRGLKMQHENVVQHRWRQQQQQQRRRQRRRRGVVTAAPVSAEHTVVLARDEGSGEAPAGESGPGGGAGGSGATSAGVDGSGAESGAATAGGAGAPKAGRSPLSWIMKDSGGGNGGDKDDSNPSSGGGGSADGGSRRPERKRPLTQREMPRRGKRDRGPPILIAKIDVVCADNPELEEQARSAVHLKPNFSYHKSDVEDCIRRFAKMGIFKSVRVDANDSRDGAELTFKIEPNERVSGVNIHDASIVPVSVIEELFQDQYGKTLNRNKVKAATKALQTWYDINHYYARVVDIVQGGNVDVYVNELGCSKITLKCVEVGTSENMTEAQMQEALRSGLQQPLTDIEVARPNLKKETLLREMTTREGSKLNDEVLHRDRLKLENINAIAAVEFGLASAQDPVDGKSTAELLVKYGEQKCRTYNLGGGLVNFGLEDLRFRKKKADNLLENLKGNFSFMDRCLFGRNETLSGSAQLGVHDISASIVHTDHWVPRDTHRTERVSSLQTSRSGVDMIHGPMDDGDGANPKENAMPVFVERHSGGIEYARALSLGWAGAIGIKGVRAVCGNADTKERVWKDQYGCPLTVQDEQADKTVLGFVNATYNAPYNPFTSLSFTVQNSVPAKKEWNLLNFTRATARIDHIVPIAQIINKQAPPARFELSAKGGCVIGDLPAYDAFSLGGANTVRGWQDGAIGTARHYGAAMAEFVLPTFSAVDAVLFCDYANDFDSGSLVPGDPAGARGKPGSGMGYGAGLRLNSMMGPIRVEYAYNGKGLSKSHFHFGRTF